jgi:hypothetical protein
MIEGFAAIFGQAKQVRIIVSEEAATYRPEMQWMSRNVNDRTITVHDATFTDFADGDAVYRFFELFDLANVRNAKLIFERALDRRIM